MGVEGPTPSPSTNAVQTIKAAAHKVKCLRSNTPPLNISIPLTNSGTVRVNKNLVHAPLLNQEIQAHPTEKLELFLRNWQKVTRDQKIQGVIAGWKIHLLQKPNRNRTPKTIQSMIDNLIQTK